MMTGDSTITIAILLVIISTVISAVSLIVSLRKGIKNETKEDSMAMTTVAVKLENLQDNMKELKVDFSSNMSDLKRDILSIRSDMNEFRERIVAVEQSAKSAHHRIDSYEKQKGEG